MIEHGGYDVFVRNWWRWERGAFGRRLVPHPGAPRRYLARGVTYERARELCAEYNGAHNPGPLSRKAEFTAA